MAATTGSARPSSAVSARRTDERMVTETKHAFKTTEFMAFVAVTVAILVSAAAIKGGDSGGTDEFIARQAWLYVSIITAGYLISRGLAKSGTHEPYWGGGTNEQRDGMDGDR
ncbi:MAG: hypothetical protein QOG94_2661 [Solirubrobacteraceae bacterium]|jgi:hypothetical protein|nr:hypothetical protein [Solirubrobacteraceae bacterium]MEA2139422.1 hypothetical protein [Solirubrobacteraceae bacterium]